MNYGYNGQGKYVSWFQKNKPIECTQRKKQSNRAFLDASGCLSLTWHVLERDGGYRYFFNKSEGIGMHEYRSV